ncbi:MAG: methyltransferase domain-containing protein [Algibacter sp.]|uniref:methyltransferase domain-containing protein n=1 Tax=Algibacter sp. TaxID=1872428 RepID=UPI00260C6540|nr:methyltransferase domain-containing protein [Algibacter sp.]MDG1728330.1 methyltransferase domain-containing protein [Algibacter sp.]MDG2178389.1 methyltransferase domain-containing protein [Algibacter sp.]
MSVKTQFSINAIHYNEYNLIQNNVIKHLLDKTDSKPISILDLGCGTGRLCNSISWTVKNFYAVDFSEDMLLIHPKPKGVKCIKGDFNDIKLFRKLSQFKVDRIFSTSSLQWATDLDASFRYIKNLNAPISFAIFTSNTFKTVFDTANIPPLLRKSEEVTSLASKYFDAKYETIKYTLSFNNPYEMFRYIKKSGVSGARNILDYKRMKNLINNYPIDYLEFEVLFITE